MCSALTAMQICKILSLYTPVDEFEQRVSPTFIRNVKAKLGTRDPDGDNQVCTLIRKIRTLKTLKYFLQSLLMDIKYRYTIRFPFNPSDIHLEDIDIPAAIDLPMLEKL